MNRIDRPGNRRRFLGYGAAAGIAAMGGSIFAQAAPAVPQNAQANLALVPQGLAGDGQADDTAAIQRAIDEAMKLPCGTSVTLPPGKYRVTRSLTMGRVLLQGLVAGGWNADQLVQPAILVDHHDGPCIIAKEAACIHGLAFIYSRHPADPPIVYPPTISLEGGTISLTNLKIVEPDEAIIADGKTNIGRLNIENVFIVNAYRRGVFVTITLDLSTLRNIEVWNPSKQAGAQCVGFQFGRNDEIRLDHCFAFNCRIGFLFTVEKKAIDDGGSVTWGGMSNCGVDFSVEGIVVEAARILRITGGSFWAHQHALRLDGPCNIIASGAELFANGDAAVIVNRAEACNISGCSLGKNASNFPHVPAMKILGGDVVLISANIFDGKGPGIVVGESIGRVAITSNVFAPSKFRAIEDDSAAAAHKLISNNLLDSAQG